MTENDVSKRGGMKDEIWKLVSGPTIPVLVGPGEKIFHLHRDLLSLGSGFFRGLLRTSFLEVQENVIKLPEDSPETFACFVEWLHTEGLSTATMVFSNDFKLEKKSDSQLSSQLFAKLCGAVCEAEREPTENEAHRMDLLISCYILADKLHSGDFAGHVIRSLIPLMPAFQSPSFLTADRVRYIYTHTAMQNDDLRHLAALGVCCGWARASIKGVQDERFSELCRGGGEVQQALWERLRWTLKWIRVEEDDEYEDYESDEEDEEDEVT